eukprot:4929817-Pleurochrysis_carterae.AAC.1
MDDFDEGTTLLRLTRGTSFALMKTPPVDQLSYFMFDEHTLVDLLHTCAGLRDATASTLVPISSLRTS